VKVRVKAATVQRVFPTAAAFKEFLKSDESLGSYNVSECETYCLANVLGVPIHQLTYNLATLAGARPEQRCKWDTLEPHQVGWRFHQMGLTGAPAGPRAPEQVREEQAADVRAARGQGRLHQDCPGDEVGF
jgi:hypothetical protein